MWDCPTPASTFQPEENYPYLRKTLIISESFHTPLRDNGKQGPRGSKLSRQSNKPRKNSFELSSHTRDQQSPSQQLEQKSNYTTHLTLDSTSPNGTHLNGHAMDTYSELEFPSSSGTGTRGLKWIWDGEVIMPEGSRTHFISLTIPSYWKPSSFRMHF